MQAAMPQRFLSVPLELIYGLICMTKVKKEEMGLKLNWLIDKVILMGNNFPKTIVFCNTLKEIASVVNLLLLRCDKSLEHVAGTYRAE